MFYHLSLIFIIMGLFSFFGCAKKEQNEKLENCQLEDITSNMNPEGGFVDFVLKITSDTKTDSSHIYIAKGLYKNKTVGLQIEISSKIRAGFSKSGIDAKNGFKRNAIQLKSIGTESDELLNALAESYKLPGGLVFTKHTISTTVFSLNEKDVNLDKRDYYKFKLFFEEDDGKLYSELFLNINTAKRIIELNEKDEEYREPLLKVWSK